MLEQRGSQQVTIRTRDTRRRTAPGTHGARSSDGSARAGADSARRRTHLGTVRTTATMGQGWLWVRMILG